MDSSRHAKPQGHSLFELLAAVAIAGIMLAIAVPRMTAFVDHTKAKASVSDIHQAFRLARQSAVEQQQYGFICPLDANNECHNDWNLPISVFVSPSRKGELTTDSQLLREFRASNHLTVATVPSTRRYFRYNSRGQLPGFMGHVRFCPTEQSTDAARLIISLGGRTRVEWESKSGNSGGCA
ncbi:MAG: GspH/FimT family pseudopilin [Natronospirillum sp.]